MKKAGNCWPNSSTTCMATTRQYSASATSQIIHNSKVIRRFSCLFVDIFTQKNVLLIITFSLCTNNWMKTWIFFILRSSRFPNHRISPRRFGHRSQQCGNFQRQILGTWSGRESGKCLNRFNSLDWILLSRKFGHQVNLARLKWIFGNTYRMGWSEGPCWRSDLWAAIEVAAGVQWSSPARR